MYVIITGASKGIGLELTRIGLKKGHHILAVARHTQMSKGLMDLKHQFNNLFILDLDLTEKKSAEIIATEVSKFPCVDVVINNAGVYLQKEDLESFQDSFLTNATIPFLITSSVFDFLKKSKRPLSLQISSLMGSLEDNSSGGSYSYRASKAALNMIFKSLSIDQQWLISILVHPGWVKTRMGGEGAPVTPEASAEGIWNVIETAQLSDSGCFYNYQKKKLPW